MKLTYQERRKQGICASCKNASITHSLCESCRTRSVGTRLRWQQKKRDKVYTAYGGYICKCCGETNPEFLTMDHINGRGDVAHRDNLSGINLLNWLEQNNYPPIIQVLCYNCNCGRSRDHGINPCPHLAEMPKEYQQWLARLKT